jgi:hypothetical protein
MTSVVGWDTLPPEMIYAILEKMKRNDICSLIAAFSDTDLFDCIEGWYDRNIHRVECEFRGVLEKLIPMDCDCKAQKILCELYILYRKYNIITNIGIIPRMPISYECTLPKWYNGLVDYPFLYTVPVEKSINLLDKYSIMLKYATSRCNQYRHAMLVYYITIFPLTPSYYEPSGRLL